MIQVQQAQGKHKTEEFWDVLCMEGDSNCSALAVPKPAIFT